MVTGDGTMHAQLPIRLDAFVLGMCAGRFAARTPLQGRLAPAAFCAGLLVLFATPLVFFDLPTGNHYYSLKGFVRPLWIASGVMLMLLGMTGERHPGVAMFGNRVSVGLGLISYSIYLFHVPVLELFITYRAKLDALARDSARSAAAAVRRAAARAARQLRFVQTDRAAVPAPSRMAPAREGPSGAAACSIVSIRCWSCSRGRCC